MADFDQTSAKFRLTSTFDRISKYSNDSWFVVFIEFGKNSLKLIKCKIDSWFVEFGNNSLTLIV